jgi:dTMP kinase
MENLRGKLISFEGLDKSGKSTQINLLKNYLKDKSLEVSVYGGLYGTPIMETIQDMILNKNVMELDKITELLLFMAARRELVVKKIAPDLKAGKTVILDRYVDSSYAYQSNVRKIKKGIIHYLNTLVITKYIPDITFLIEIGREEYKNRIRKELFTDSLDKIEADIVDKYTEITIGYNILKYKHSERIFSIYQDTEINMHEAIKAKLKDL